MFFREEATYVRARACVYVCVSAGGGGEYITLSRNTGPIEVTFHIEIFLYKC